MDALLGFIANHPEQVNAFAAVCALVISLVSIVLAWSTARNQREHDIKSVTPFAHVSLGDYRERISVKLDNYGIGPLIIDRFSVTDGQREKEDVISWMPGLPDGIVWNDYRGNPDRLAIPASGQIIMLQLIGNPQDKAFLEFRDQVRHILSKLKVTIAYHDIYGNKMPTYERAMTWFAR